MEGQVARARAGMQVCLALWPQPPRFEVEVIGEDRADAIVHGQHPAAGRVGGDHVRVRLGVLHHVGGCVEGTVGIDREHRETPRAPVGTQQIPPAGVHRHMDRQRAAAALGAEQPQVPVIADRERARQPVGQLMGGVQGPPARRHRQKRRILRTAGDRRHREHTLAQGRRADPLPALRTVAAEVDHRVSIPTGGTICRAARATPPRRSATARTTGAGTGRTGKGQDVNERRGADNSQEPAEGRKRPLSSSAWSTFGPHPIGCERFQRSPAARRSRRPPLQSWGNKPWGRTLKDEVPVLLPSRRSAMTQLGAGLIQVRTRRG